MSNPSELVKTETLNPEEMTRAVGASQRSLFNGGVTEGFVTRARRLLAGDVRDADYLPVPDEVAVAVADEIQRVEQAEGFIVAPIGKQRLLNDWTLLHHHLRDVVLARITDRGVLVLAVGDDEIGLLHANRIEPVGFTLISPMFD